MGERNNGTREALQVGIVRLEGQCGAGTARGGGTGSGSGPGGAARLGAVPFGTATTPPTEVERIEPLAIGKKMLVKGKFKKCITR